MISPEFLSEFSKFLTFVLAFYRQSRENKVSLKVAGHDGWNKMMLRDARVHSIFISRPTWVAPEFRKGLEGFLRVLESHRLRPRTLGAGDYGRRTPLDEVIWLLNQCSGAIILGYPQIKVVSGSLKAESIPKNGDGDFLLATEWNHIEAGLAYARGLPLLVIHHIGVRRGIFDRGAMNSFLYERDLADPAWVLREDISTALVEWKTELVGRRAPRRK